MRSRLPRPVLVPALVLVLCALMPSTAASAVTTAANGTIHGIVTDAWTGKPIEGARIDAYRYDAADASWYTAANTVSGADGSYSLPVGAATYRVGFYEYRVYQPVFWPNAAGAEHASDVVVASGGSVRIDQALVPMGSISGRVTSSAEGSGVADVLVSAYRIDDGYTQYAEGAWTDAEGDYTIPGLAVGTYRVVVNPWDSDRLKDVAETWWPHGYTLDEGADLVLSRAAMRGSADVTVEPAAHIVGHAGMFGATDTLYRKDALGRWLPLRSGIMSPPDYRFDALGPGDYKLQFVPGAGFLPQFWNGEPDISSAGTITLSAGETMTCDADLAEAAWIQGEAIGSDTGAYIPDLVVDAYKYSSAEGTWTLGYHYTQVFTPTDPDPGYTLNVPGGTYRLAIGSASGRYVTKWYPNAATIGAASDVTIADAGRLTISRVTLAKAPASSGRASRIGRIAGVDRYDTAIKVSQAAFPHADTVVLARGDNFPDALSASALAGAYDAPILLTKRDYLPGGLIDELRRLSAHRVMLVGSTDAISAHVEDQLRAAEFTDITRLQGKDRYETAAEVARHLKAHFAIPPEVFVARGDNFPDALALAPFAWRQKRPILLVKPTGAPPATVQALHDLGADTAIVAGDTRSVPVSALEQLAGGTAARRLYYYRASGADRYATAAAIARFWGRKYAFVGVATGQTFPDALAGAALVGRLDGTLLLTPKSPLSPAAKSVLDEGYFDIYGVRVFGGTASVSDAALTTIHQLLD